MGTTQRVFINNAAASTEHFQDEQETTTKRADGPGGLRERGAPCNTSVSTVTLKHNRFPKGTQTLSNKAANCVLKLHSLFKLNFCFVGKY